MLLAFEVYFEVEDTAIVPVFALVPSGAKATMLMVLLNCMSPACALAELPAVLVQPFFQSPPVAVTVMVVPRRTASDLAWARVVNRSLVAAVTRLEAIWPCINGAAIMARMAKMAIVTIISTSENPEGAKR